MTDSGAPRRGRSPSVLVLIVIAVVALVLAYVMTPSAAGQALSPFQEAGAALTKQYPAIQLESARQLSAISDEARERVVQTFARNSTFVAVRPDGVTVVPTEKYSSIVGYRELLDHVVQAGDLEYELTWMVNDTLVRSPAIADSEGRLKFEPVLYTIAGDIEGAVGVARHASPSVPLVVAFSKRTQAVRRDAPSAFERKNLLGMRVVWISLEILNRSARPYLTPSKPSGHLPLWRIDGDIDPREYKLEGRECLDALMDVTWGSYLPAISLKEFSIENLELVGGRTYLRNSACRSA